MERYSFFNPENEDEARAFGIITNMAVNFAANCRGGVISLDDLLSAGVIGLLDAKEKFNPS